LLFNGDGKVRSKKEVIIREIAIKRLKKSIKQYNMIVKM
jgi:hypothetical protein